MLAFFAILTLSNAMMGSPARLNDFGGQTPSSPAPASSPELPPPPRGKSTVIGGEIRSVDPVRDQFKLAIFHGKSITVLYDERTQVDRDGVKIAVINLKPSDQASVETTLDGQVIFALRIHALSARPEGELQGKVVSFNPSTSELELDVTASKQPLALHVGPDTRMTRVGQNTSSGAPEAVSALPAGSLVNVKFKRGKDGRSVATQVSVVAVPGSVFQFAGELSFVDLPGGRFTIAEGNDSQSQDITFEAARFPESHDLREGTRVRVTAVFDGTRYVAKEIAVE